MSLSSLANVQPFTVARLDAGHLGEHFRECIRASGRLHRLRCAADALYAFVAPRLVTTAVLGALLLLGGTLLLR